MFITLFLTYKYIVRYHEFPDLQGQRDYREQRQIKTERYREHAVCMSTQRSVSACERGISAIWGHNNSLSDMKMQLGQDSSHSAADMNPATSEHELEVVCNSRHTAGFHFD